MFFNDLKVPSTYVLVDTPRKLAWLEKELMKSKIFAFDIETTHPTILNKVKKRDYKRITDVKLAGISFAWGRYKVEIPWKPGNAAYIPIVRSDESRYWGRLHDNVMNIISRILGSLIPKIAHNGKFDVKELYKLEKIKTQNACHDTMLMYGLLDEENINCSFALKSEFNSKGEIRKLGLSDYLLDTSASQFKGDLDDALTHYDKNYRRYHKVPLKYLYPYGCADSDLTLSLKLVLEDMIKEEGLSWVYNNITMPLSNVIMQMELHGCPLDVGEAKRVETEQLAIVRSAESKIHQIVGREFKATSTEQLGNVLFNELGFKGGTRNKKGWVVDRNELKRLKVAYNHPIIDPVIDLRRAQKIGGTYATSSLNIVDDFSEDGKIGWVHPEIFLISKTGRLRCKDPNLTNLPRSDYGGKIVKGMYRCPEDYVFIFKDFSQMELRVIAHVSQEPVWIDGFNAGQDMHSSMAKLVFNLPCDADQVENLYTEKRSQAKAVNFGIAYGQSIYSLSEKLGITYEVAEDLINNKYFGQAPTLKSWIDQTHKFTEIYGYVDNIFKRRRHLPDAQIVVPRGVKWPAKESKPTCYREAPKPYELDIDLDDIYDVSEASIGQQIKIKKLYRSMKCAYCPHLKSCFINTASKTLKGKKNRAMRQSVNFIIQGSAADMSSLSLIWVNQEMKKHRIESTPVLYIHDELGCYTHKDHVDAACKVMDYCMTTKLKKLTNFSVPLKVDTSVVKCWGDK